VVFDFKDDGTGYGAGNCIEVVFYLVTPCAPCEYECSGKAR
jgi:hypothetical protein